MTALVSKGSVNCIVVKMLRGLAAIISKPCPQITPAVLQRQASTVANGVYARHDEHH